MCGIFGFTGSLNPELLTTMAKRLHHRGPDGEGYFSNSNFSMGMKRLSIIDLEGGSQPIYNENQTITVCYNGEIYNYLELRQQLLNLGHHFKTCSDTEVIVHAYEEWGVQCLQHFNGMYAFALYDITKNKLFIARDRSGQKPLYYYYQNNKFIFASEIKAILAADTVANEVNISAIDNYLTLRYVPEPQTLFKNIETLPAAHYLVLENKKLTLQRYWNINLIHNKKYLSEKDSFNLLENKLTHAVNLVLRSDVPVGAYLSGGIDSSLLVALMCQKHKQVNTYSIGFNSHIDETREAQETARMFGTQHHEAHCTPQDFELLPKIIYQMDRPVGDALIIAFYKMAQLASKDVKVVLSGEGADEIFAGYQFHKVLQLFEFYRRIMPDIIHQQAIVPCVNLLPAQLLNLFFKFPAELGSEGKQNFISFLRTFSKRSLENNYRALKTLWRENSRKNLYTESYKNLITSQNELTEDYQGAFLDRLLKLQWEEWLQDWAIIRQDKNAMAHSVEVRLPYLDHELIELAFKINPKFKATFFKDKIIQRQLANKMLPRKITMRPKKPFYFPMQYFSEHSYFNALVDLTLNKNQILKRGYFNYDYIKNLLQKTKNQEFIYLKQIVSLVILELWHMIFIDKTVSV